MRPPEQNSISSENQKAGMHAQIPVLNGRAIAQRADYNSCCSAVSSVATCAEVQAVYTCILDNANNNCKAGLKPRREEAPSESTCGEWPGSGIISDPLRAPELPCATVSAVVGDSRAAFAGDGQSGLGSSCRSISCSRMLGR